MLIEGLGSDAAGPDPATITRIERDRESAMTRYRRDRDATALEATMRRLDQDEAEAQVTQADLPTAAEATEYLGDLPRLWEEAEGSGRRLLAEALFERIDVLGAGKVHLHPSASARAQGWAEAWDGARLVVMVGARGFEPPTSSSRTMRATKLRHAPTEEARMTGLRDDSARQAGPPFALWFGAGAPTGRCRWARCTQR